MSGKSEAKGVAGTNGLLLSTTVTVCDALDSVVSTTFGPTGTDTLLVTPGNDLVLTSSGSQLLASVSAEHCLARLLLRAATKQGDRAGDGGSGVVIGVAAGLRQALEEATTGKLGSHARSLQAGVVALVHALSSLHSRWLPQVAEVAARVLARGVPVCLGPAGAGAVGTPDGRVSGNDAPSSAFDESPTTCGGVSVCGDDDAVSVSRGVHAGCRDGDDCRPSMDSESRCHRPSGSPWCHSRRVECQVTSSTCRDASCNGGCRPCGYSKGCHLSKGSRDCHGSSRSPGGHRGDFRCCRASRAAALALLYPLYCGKLAVPVARQLAAMLVELVFRHARAMMLAGESLPMRQALAQMLDTPPITCIPGAPFSTSHVVDGVMLSETLISRHMTLSFPCRFVVLRCLLEADESGTNGSPRKGAPVPAPSLLVSSEAQYRRALSWKHSLLGDEVANASCHLGMAAVQLLPGEEAKRVCRAARISPVSALALPRLHEADTGWASSLTEHTLGPRRMLHLRVLASRSGYMNTAPALARCEPPAASGTEEEPRRSSARGTFVAPEEHVKLSTSSSGADMAPQGVGKRPVDLLQGDDRNEHASKGGENNEDESEGDESKGADSKADASQHRGKPAPCKGLPCEADGKADASTGNERKGAGDEAAASISTLVLRAPSQGLCALYRRMALRGLAVLRAATVTGGSATATGGWGGEAMAEGKGEGDGEGQGAADHSMGHRVPSVTKPRDGPEGTPLGDLRAEKAGPLQDATSSSLLGCSLGTGPPQEIFMVIPGGCAFDLAVASLVEDAMVRHRQAPILPHDRRDNSEHGLSEQSLITLRQRGLVAREKSISQDSLPSSSQGASDQQGLASPELGPATDRDASGSLSAEMKHDRDLSSVMADAKHQHSGNVTSIMADVERRHTSASIMAALRVLHRMAMAAPSSLSRNCGRDGGHRTRPCAPPGAQGSADGSMGGRMASGATSRGFLELHVLRKGCRDGLAAHPARGCGLIVPPPLSAGMASAGCGGNVALETFASPCGCLERLLGWPSGDPPAVAIPGSSCLVGDPMGWGIVEPAASSVERLLAAATVLVQLLRVDRVVAGTNRKGRNPGGLVYAGLAGAGGRLSSSHKALGSGQGSGSSDSSGTGSEDEGSW
eukprot:jgi/Mesvir1/27322/Mv07142-RA.2